MAEDIENHPSKSSESKEFTMAEPTSTTTTTNPAPTLSTDAVLKPSTPVPTSALEVSGIDFDTYTPIELSTLSKLVSQMSTTGLQATAVADAAAIINKMIDWRCPETGAKSTIFLGYTSNLVSSGLRSVLRYLVQHKHVSAIVTTAGGVEEDLIKCLAPTYLSSFSAPGAAMREKGMNRIGNLMVPNDNYCLFEDWVVPILSTMFAEQEASLTSSFPLVWTPSTVIARLGKEIGKHPKHEESILYWAYKNNIPIFSPALTDGSLGDMLHFHTFRTSPSYLTIDITRDIRRINSLSLSAARAGMIVLGGGLVKHHIANACLMRNGADEAVFINTAQEFDGSDAGARPDEAVSWGKLKAEGASVKVYAEATVVFPLIVAASFAQARSAGEQKGGEKGMD